MSATSLITSAGARSRWALIFTGVVMAFVILLFAGVVEYVAMPALAARRRSALTVHGESSRASKSARAPAKVPDTWVSPIFRLREPDPSYPDGLFTEPDEIVRIVEAIAPTFGGINLEDIKAPECFDIERRLRDRMSIPVMHDDQHGTAICVAAAVRNGLRLVDKRIEDVRLVGSGAGAVPQRSVRTSAGSGSSGSAMAAQSGGTPP